MPSREQLEEKMQQFMEKRQAIFDAYFRVFGTEDGRSVLRDMHDRAFYKISLFTGQEGKDRGVRDYREGQRSFMLETDSFIEKGRTGAKPPTQAQAISNTAEPRNET